MKLLAGLALLVGAADAFGEPRAFGNLTSTSYNAATAADFVNLAESAYCSSDAIESWSCASCKRAPTLEGISVINTDDNQAFVGYDSASDSVIVSFRGSSNIENWISNIDAVKTSFHGVDVHKGFYEIWEAIKSDVEKAIDGIRSTYSSSAQVATTGHSLGAALAVLAAFDFESSDLYDVVGVWTMGCPRVGDSDFVTAYDKAVATNWRLTHYHDIVPHVPEELLGFHHTSTEVWYNEANSDYSVCDGSGEDGDCSNSCSPFSCTSTSDHLDYLGVSMGSGGC